MVYEALQARANRRFRLLATQLVGEVFRVHLEALGDLEREETRPAARVLGEAEQLLDVPRLADATNDEAGNPAPFSRSDSSAAPKA